MGKNLIGYAAGALLVVAALLVSAPYFARSRVTSAPNSCVNILRQIDGAKQQWAVEFQKTTNDAPSWATLRPYLGRGASSAAPSCPDGGIYSLGNVGESPRCSNPGHRLP